MKFVSLRSTACLVVVVFLEWCLHQCRLRVNHIMRIGFRSLHVGYRFTCRWDHSGYFQCDVFDLCGIVGLLPPCVWMWSCLFPVMPTGPLAHKCLPLEMGGVVITNGNLFKLSKSGALIWLKSSLHDQIIRSFSIKYGMSSYNINALTWTTPWLLSAAVLATIPLLGKLFLYRQRKRNSWSAASSQSVIL